MSDTEHQEFAEDGSLDSSEVGERGDPRDFLAFFVIALGLWFHAQAPFHTYHHADPWPFFVIGPGVALLGLALLWRVGGRAFAFIGGVVASVGLLLLYQDRFDHFESWAYAWPLVAFFGPGAALTLYGARIDRDRMIAKGRKMMTIGIALTAIGLAFFEGLIGLSGQFLPYWFEMGSLWPIALIVAGVWLLGRPEPADAEPAI